MSGFCLEKNTRISQGFSLKLMFNFPLWPGDKQLSCFFDSENPESRMAIFNGLLCLLLHFVFFFFAVKNFSLWK